jgi:hypothetical protein
MQEQDLDAAARQRLAGLRRMREAFPANQISKLPKETKQQADERKANRSAGIRCKECDGWHHRDAVHLDYIGHAALTDRLLDADPVWEWKPLAYDEHGLPRFDDHGGMWAELTICGVTRICYGHAEVKSYQSPGDRIKEVIGDMLRNGGMRFGAGLELWHKGDLHPDEPPANGGAPQPPEPAAATKPKKATKTAPAESQAPAAPQAVTPVTLIDVLKAFQGAYSEQELVTAGGFARQLPEKDKAAAKKAYQVRLAELKRRDALLSNITRSVTSDARFQALIDFCGGRLGVILQKRAELPTLETDQLEQIALWLGNKPEPEVAL